MAKEPSEKAGNSTGDSLRVIGMWSAALLVIANMIGSGVFTTTGFMAADITSEPVILMVWVAGGLLALCGALTYGELASSMPRSGGEYYYLSKLYHPSIGFLSGFVSLIVGFSAPIAGSSLVFAKYLTVLLFPDLDEEISGYWVRGIAFVLVAALTFMHSSDVKKGAATQNIFTVLKVSLVVFFILAGLTLTPAPRDIEVLPSGTDWDAILSPAFATALVFVFYAFSGWNAAAYIAGEVRKPDRNLPRALLIGAGTVTVLYILLNYVFLYTAAPAEIAGKEEFGDIVADKIFGAEYGWIMSSLIAFALISSVSSMVMAGPRVTAAIGEDFPFFRKLGKKNKSGSPVMALLIQLVVAAAMILYGDVMVIFTYIGFTLSIFAFLTVFGLYLQRIRHGKPKSGYRTPGYPLTPALFLVLVGWLIVFSIKDNWLVPVIGGGTLLAGIVIYYFTSKGVTVKDHNLPPGELPATPPTDDDPSAGQGNEQ